MTGGYDEATLRRLGEQLSAQRLLQMLTQLQSAASGLSRSVNRRTDAELCLIRLSDEGLDESFAGLSARIARVEERLAKGITGGSAYGPWRKVENGTVTWQREELLADGGSQEDGGPSPEKAPTRLSTLSVPIIPYVLAEQEWSSSEKEQSPEQDPS